MLYRSLLLFKHGGTYVRPGTLVELDDKDEIKTLKSAKAIADYERRIETAMKPEVETREVKPKKKGRRKK